MFPLAQIIPSFIDNAFDAIKDYFPSEEAKNKAKLAMLEAQQAGKFKDTEQQLSAILAEANSTDPWTSRARPTFLYVIYIMILSAIPMGFLGFFHPDMATAVAEGMDQWLKAIPDSMWQLFGVGYLGYTGGRSWEKGKGVTK